ncbi:MAG: DNA gyrase subunit A [Coriobacteriales bacterium]|nr:DNA gyrase subunit A [Coriobacteriales bacterium]
MAMEMRQSFLEYAMSVIVARALPDVRDGLKPVHRRILYAMHESGITPGKPHKKSAWTVGEVIGKYHPHGDVAVYDTMVRLAQDFSLRVPLVDGHGNFGSVDGERAAAMRYTEARLDKAAMDLLRDLDKDTVDWQPNYDESLQEPSVLPSRFPNLLVNGSSGIAVGMATNIPQHNLGEVVDAVSLLLDNEQATLDDVMQVLPGPDFPTGALIMGKNGIREAYETGRGSLTLRTRERLEKTSSGRERIIIYEFPYMVNRAKLEEKINELMRDKKLPEISVCRDESDRNGIRFLIELKSGAIAQVLLNKLYKLTQMQTTFGVNMLALVDSTPRQLSLMEMLHHYIAHQEEVLVRRTRFDLKKAEERAHILDGLLIALDNIDEVIRIIRSSKDDNEARTRLMERFGLTQPQTDAILEMRLRRLTGLEYDKIAAELTQLRERISYFKTLLQSRQMQHDVLKEELLEIKNRLSNKRRTELANDAKDLEVEDLIAEEDMVVTVTSSGYVKRLPVATYRQQKRGGKGLQGVNLKSEDFVEHLFVASTHDYMLFFSTRGKVYRLKVHELPVGSRHARGTAIVNLLPFEQDEKIAAIIATKEFPENEYLLFATSGGMTKKTAMSAYRNSRRDGLIAINLREGDSLIAVRRVKEGERVLMVASNGKAICWDEKEARPMGRDTMGVKGMATSEGAEVIGMEVARLGAELLVITEKGYGKRTPVEDYPLHHRGGQGVYTIQMTAKKGPLVAMRIIMPGQELMIISLEGVMIRVKSTDISLQGRATQGVRIMNVGENDRVTAVARIATSRKTGRDEDADADEGVTAEGVAGEDAEVGPAGEAHLELFNAENGEGAGFTAEDAEAEDGIEAPAPAGEDDAAAPSVPSAR